MPGRVPDSQMSKRTLATLLALNRIQYGLGMIFTPQRNAKVWVGARAARRTPTKVLAQALGARDLVLGAGALLALRDPAEAQRWFTALAVADAVDIPVTALAGEDVPLASRAATLTIAVASTAIGVAYAASPE
jgi:hypothetical protein